ncbi:MAG: metallophosphoesterase [Chloroherpetonaceae bacterium]|nr:metallophosphoesterase [Chloroherpetonaceae bacterium]MDW8437380.1 metallophosphoesterase [Chloroherpetonaceae bacterium]
MPPITLARLLLVLLLSLLAGAYVCFKLLKLVDAFKPRHPKPIRIFVAVLVGALMTTPALTLFLRFEMDLREEEAMYALFTLSSVWAMWVLLTVVVFALLDACGFVGRVVQRFARRPKFAGEEEPVDLSRREFLTKTATTIAPLAVGFGFPSVITAYSVANHRSDYVVNSMTLRFPNLPTELRGLKIAHLSDIHSGAYMPQRKMEEIVEVVNALSPDIVALTGDFVSSYIEEIEPLTKAFQGLKTTFGAYSCAGNHDEWAGIAPIEAAMNEKRLNLLRNRSHVLNIDGAKLNVIGIDFGREKKHYLDRALKSADKEGFKLLLCHHPDFFIHAKERGVDLTLAGHTHGGQISIEFGGFEFYPIDLFYKYPRGLYEEGERKSRKLYVSLGVGVTGTPLRTVQAEIALITLERA